MKGQTALEYIMTYGWAILAVIVIIAALYSMGVFSQTEIDLSIILENRALKSLLIAIVVVVIILIIIYLIVMR